MATAKRRCSRSWLALALVFGVLAAAAAWVCVRPKVVGVRPGDHLFPARFASKYGYVTKAGDEALPFVWDRANFFDSHGMAAVMRDDKWGWIDRTGALVIPCKWDGFVGDFDERGHLAVHDGFHQTGWIDRAGNSVEREPLDWDTLSNDELGWQVEQRHGKVGWTDRGGKLVIPHRWDKQFFGFVRGLALVQRAKKMGMIDRKGKEVISCEWDDLSCHDARGMARGRRDGKIGWIDRAGAVAIPLADWEDAQDFGAFDLAPVMHRGKWGWIDRTGRLALPCEWDVAFAFAESGYAEVIRDRNRGVIDRHGKRVVPCQWGTTAVSCDGGIQGSAWAHPLMDYDAFRWLAEKTGLDRSAMFNGLTAWHDANGRQFWRSDLHAARPALPPLAVVFALLSVGAFWRARRLASISGCS